MAFAELLGANASNDEAKKLPKASNKSPACEIKTMQPLEQQPSKNIRRSASSSLSSNSISAAEAQKIMAQILPEDRTLAPNSPPCTTSNKAAAEDRNLNIKIILNAILFLNKKKLLFFQASEKLNKQRFPSLKHFQKEFQLKRISI